MEEVYNLIIGVAVLILGIPIGNLLANSTKEELHKGRKWFNLLMILSLIGAVIFLFTKYDAIFFTFLFMTIVVSRSVK